MEESQWVYDKNQLVEVICQLRFPSVLRIDTESPTAFQDAIRKPGAHRGYPMYILKRNLPFQLSFPTAKLPPPLAAMTSTMHEFASEDGHCKINLNRDFLAISTTKYTRWQDFGEDIHRVLELFKSEYSPSFFSRVGLRYRNEFKRTEL